MQLETPIPFNDYPYSPYSFSEVEEEEEIPTIREYTKFIEELEPFQRFAAGVFTVAISDLHALSKPVKCVRSCLSGGMTTSKPLEGIRWFLENPDGGELLASSAGLNKDFFVKYKLNALPLLEKAEQTNPHLTRRKT